ncbi:Hypothetical protein A7982_05660 [Minicystis rosea]|nr:Hypothetical protein A7982_05660 [Minicystis rosea]
MSKTAPRARIKSGLRQSATIALLACAAVAGAATGCDQILGLGNFKNCPEDSGCPEIGGPSCAMPADCPVGDECSTPVCTGGKCGLAARDDGLTCKTDADLGHRCQAGACVCPSENQCGAACVDTQTDANHCGACDKACPMGIACVNGACDCPNSGEVCGTACVDTQTDATNCGACGKTCTVTGATCALGACVCPDGGMECSGACVDTQTDASNCGECGKACTAPTTVCSGGECVCPDPLIACAGACIEPQNDAHNCGSCGHDCLGGTCQDGMCQPIVLASGQSFVAALAVTATSLYWTNADSSGATLGAVMKLSLGGGSPSVLAASQPQPAHLALDATNAYWTSITGTYAGGTFTLAKVPLSGGTAATLIPNQTIPAYKTGPYGLVVDAQNVYWINNSAGTISKVPIAGGTPVVLASGLTSPVFLVAVGANLYYSAGGVVYALPKAGGAATPVINACSTKWLAVNSTHVFASCAGATGTGTLQSVPAAGGAPTTLAASLSMPRRVVADSSSVYWFDDNDKTINRISVDGGNTTVLVTGVATTSLDDGIAFDATSLYWTTHNAGTVTRLAK